MPHPDIDRIHAWLRDHESNLLEDYRSLLRFPSVESAELPNAPFGQANRDALDFMLDIGNRWGMRTKDLEGYVGFAEFGAGDKLILSLGHLDVVPVGAGWKHEPFGAEIDGEYVYSRGAVDDKGPTMASFYAMRAIQECVPNIPSRMRSVFGCDEESGFKCIERYVQTEEAPTYGVAPDSGWPLYHAEKGIANLLLDVPLPQGELTLVRIAGGQRPNIVIDSCTAEVKVAPSLKAHVEELIADSWDRNVEKVWENSELLKITAIGKASHGAWPFGGDSAAIRLMRFLVELAPLEQEKAYTDLFELTHISGSGLGAHGWDAVSKDLTCNLGIVETVGSKARLTFNIRYPVTWKGGDLRDKVLARLGEVDSGYELVEFSDSPPLYFPLDHPMVKVIRSVYLEETGEDREPGVMGGGTYARAIPNTVSIGTGWDGDGKAHETDERLKVEHLYKMSRIYAHILYELASL